jgi:hypothetical protein
VEEQAVILVQILLLLLLEAGEQEVLLQIQRQVPQILEAEAEVMVVARAQKTGARA